MLRFDARKKTVNFYSPFYVAVTSEPFFSLKILLYFETSKTGVKEHIPRKKLSRFGDVSPSFFYLKTRTSVYRTLPATLGPSILPWFYLQDLQRAGAATKVIKTDII